MIINDFRDVSRELAAIQRRLSLIEAQLRARQAEPDGAAIDAMIGRQLDALERSMASDWFEDEQPVRAVSPRR